MTSRPGPSHAANLSANIRQADLSLCCSGQYLPPMTAALRAARGILSRADIEHLLAHRAPFLFITRAAQNVPGKSIVGYIEESPSLPFPPPQIVILEALGQAGALVVKQVRDTALGAYSGALERVTARKARLVL